jgi:predicted permease
VLAGLGGVVGLLLAFAGVGMLAAFAERYSPRASEIRVDGAVLGFTSALVLIVAVVLSYAPKLANERTIGALIAAGGKRTTAGARRQRLQQALVVAQIAVSVMLLTGAGLLTRTMQQLSNVDPGLDPENVLTMEVPIDFGAESTELAVARYERMQGELSALPGVRQVAFGSTMPLRSAGFLLEVKAENRVEAPGEAMPRAEYRTTSPDYFSAAGIPLLRGRDFSATDRLGGAPVVILNQTLAGRLFGDEDPIGRRVAWTGSVLEFIPVSGDWRTVVGVVGDTKDGGLDALPIPAMFMPFVQEAFPSGGLVIRSRGDAAALVPQATRIVREIAPQQPIENVLTLDQIRDESVGPRRLNAMLVGSFGLLALIVASIGIAAVLAFSVSARTNEIGIRMSIGADSGMVQRMVLSEGGLLVAIGLTIGVIGALAFSRLIQGLLFGIEPHDPATLAGVSLVMAVVGILACWIPALKASRIDPGIALRAST